MAVVIPLNILNVCSAEDLVHTLNNVFTHFLTGKVEGHLISAKGTFPALNADRPIGMRTVKVAVGVNALGLEPKAEFHTHLIDLISYILDAAGQLLAVLYPVAETGKVVVTLAKPAVVKDEHLNS